MLTRISGLLMAVILSNAINAQLTLEYYLPKDVTFNPGIPVPKQIIGFEVGEWHVSHDKLYQYMTELSRISDRAIWEEYARSYENRPLGQLIISSPENIKNLEFIRDKHLELCDPVKSDNTDITNMPVIIKLGYGIHGNESSTQNAALLTAYYLTAAEGKKIDELLSHAVILIDPALNPDGLQRHSGWVNHSRSLNNNPDPNSLEFNEPWPGGRTNHYWFDLNRDYLLLQHPESIGRVEAFFKWRPNIITDHHEMGPDATFFFQPGVPSRNNPLVPSFIYELTSEIAGYHEKFLNKTGSLYYSEEGYDDFYVGKGSSYPDIHGSVGILFEQAGVKGHLRETQSGLLSFTFAIKNHFTVTLSSLEAGFEMREKLLHGLRNFYKEAISSAEKYPVKAYVFSEPDDEARISRFIEILLKHQIKVFHLSKDISKNGMEFKAANSYVVPLKQAEFRFIRSIFEPAKKFTDSTFYDVSTWILPMSFNIPYCKISTGKDMLGLTGEELIQWPSIEGELLASEDPYAYLFEWKEYYAPKALYRLQDSGIKARVATDEFICNIGTSLKRFSYGTIMVPANGQSLSKNEIRRLMDLTAKECGIKIYGVNTGLTPKGIDLGSGSFNILKKPSVLMFAGDGVNSADAGEIWHMFDIKFSMPLTIVPASRAGSVNLDRYNVVIISGSPGLSQQVIERIKEWNQKGGTLIAYKNGNDWLNRNKFAEIEYIPVPEVKKESGKYAEQTSDRLINQIPGTIFNTKLDLTHPLCFGYSRDILPVIKNSTTAVRKNKNIYSNPIIYSDEVPLSGYCNDENTERLKGSAFVSCHGNRIISIYDNTNFRAIWYGTDKIFMNAVFFGQIIK